MKILKTRLDGLLIIEPDVFRDDRGYFFESFNREAFLKLDMDLEFVQDNESRSGKGVLRGLHFQVPPKEQGKLVRVVRGSVVDVAVDLRKKSPTFGKWERVELDGTSKRMLWIPPGFAHGFLTLEDDTVFSYKCTAVYNRESEKGIAWNDPDLAIGWGVTDPILSEKDKKCISFREFNSPF
jgi:dTDP-4-dehydrorhamnose 3,5-epimerase